jgi:hypothetical protein
MEAVLNLCVNKETMHENNVKGTWCAHGEAPWKWTTKVVAILTLGSQPRQGVARLRAKKEARESCRMLPGV